MKRLSWLMTTSVALACSPAVPDHPGDPNGTGAAAGQSGASSMPAGGSSGESNAAGGAPGSGGQPSPGGSGGVIVSGGAPNGGAPNGGAPNGGAPNGGAPSGGTPSGGAGGCTQNVACTLAAPASTGDMYQDCVDRINQFRTQCVCLPPLARWTDGEACANQMAEYDSTAPMAHAGFQAKICSGGSAQDECPGWRSSDQVISGCLQQMWDEGPPPQDPCTGTCYQDHGHFINMTNTRMTKVACGFFTTPAGKVWSVQNFSR